MTGVWNGVVDGAGRSQEATAVTCEEKPVEPGRSAVVAGIVVAAFSAFLWTINPLFGMAALPVAPVLLLSVVLGSENVLRRLNYPSARNPRSLRR